MWLLMYAAIIYDTYNIKRKIKVVCMVVNFYNSTFSDQLLILSRFWKISCSYCGLTESNKNNTKRCNKNG